MRLEKKLNLSKDSILVRSLSGILKPFYKKFVEAFKPPIIKRLLQMLYERTVKRLVNLVTGLLCFKDDNVLLKPLSEHISS